MLRAIIACLALAAFAAAAQAQSPPATLADVDWLQGYWDGEGMGGTVEDIWMPPRAGVMIGDFRLVLRREGDDARFKRRPL